MPSYAEIFTQTARCKATNLEANMAPDYDDDDDDDDDGVLHPFQHYLTLVLLMMMWSQLIQICTVCHVLC